MLSISAAAPSYVFTSEIASLVLRTDWLRLLISARILAATAIPAASSAALLMRLPDARRSIDFSRSARFSDRIREAVIEEMLVLTTTPMIFSCLNEGELSRLDVPPAVIAPAL